MIEAKKQPLALQDCSWVSENRVSPPPSLQERKAGHPFMVVVLTHSTIEYLKGPSLQRPNRSRKARKVLTWASRCASRGQCGGYPQCKKDDVESSLTFPAFLLILWSLIAYNSSS